MVYMWLKWGTNLLNLRWPLKWSLDDWRSGEQICWTCSGVPWSSEDWEWFTWRCLVSFWLAGRTTDRSSFPEEKNGVLIKHVKPFINVKKHNILLEFTVVLPINGSYWKIWWAAVQFWQVTVNSQWNISKLGPLTEVLLVYKQSRTASFIVVRNYFCCPPQWVVSIGQKWLRKSYCFEGSGEEERKESWEEECPTLPALIFSDFIAERAYLFWNSNIFSQ